MTDGADSTLTLRQILLEQGSDGDGVAEGAQQETGADTLGAHLERLPPALRAAAAEQIVTLVARVLDRRLVDLLGSGWRKWEQLAEAGRRTLHDPGEVEIVELVDHEIASIQRPHVDITFDGRKVAEVGAEAAVEITLHSVTAVVEEGRLSALRSGRADVDARLSIEGALVAEASRQVDLSIEIALGDGIPLVEAAERVTALPDADR